VVPPTPGIVRAALICGILSVTCLWCFAAVPAIICGHIGQSRINRSGGTLGGSGLALAGLIMGYVSLALSVLLIPLLLAIAIPSFERTRQHSRQAETQNMIRQLNVAIRSYEVEYGHLPMPPINKDTVVENAIVLDALTGVDEQLNPKKIPFFIPSGRLNGHILTDSWGNRFNFAFDGDGDGAVLLSGKAGNAVPESVAVWSDGINGKDDNGNGDDIASWKPLPEIEP
jgi:type II secretory pathway pseudopilin PulG